MRPDLIAPQRAAFDVPADVAYFNTAMLAPQLHAVRAAGAAALEFRGRPWAISATEDFSRLADYRDEHQPGARRFDVGQRTKCELTPMAIAALEQILAWGVPSVAVTLAARTAEIARRATELRLDPAPAEQRGPHLLGVRLPSGAGAHAITALAEVNCFAAVRGSSLRISPHLHTTGEDVARLLDGLALAAHRNAIGAAA